MQTSLVLTLIGSDRPGLVESLAQAVAEHGGNWVQSHMSRLAGKFAGVLRVDVPADRAHDLAAALQRLQQRGLTIVVETSGDDARPETLRWLHLQVLGHDRPGIVRDVSHALAMRHVNVVELETECFSAPMSGETMFKATADLRVPVGLKLHDLREALEQIAEELALDIHLEERVESPSAVPDGAA